MATVYFAKWLLLPSGEVLTNGAIAVEGCRITSVGNRATVKRSSQDRMVNCGDLLLMPGLINMHTHLEEGVVRGMGKSSEETFTSWIAKRGTRCRQASAEARSAAIRLGIRELLTNGITTVVDNSRSTESAGAFSGELIRAWHIRELHDDESASEESLQQDAQGRCAAITDPELLHVGIGPHAFFSLSPKIHRAVIDHTRTKGWQWFCHIAESAEELQAFSEHAGDLYFYVTRRRPWPFGDKTQGSMFYAITNGLIPNNAVLFHCNYTTGHELSLLAAKGVSIVLTPQYDRMMEHKQFPVDVALNRGVNLCLGTESRADSEGLSLFDELYEMRRAYPHLSASVLLRMVTTNAAKALRTAGDIGVLAPGAYADIIGVSYAHDPRGDILEELLEETPSVRLALVNGEEVIVDF